MHIVSLAIQLSTSLAQFGGGLVLLQRPMLKDTSESGVTGSRSLSAPRYHNSRGPERRQHRHVEKGPQ